MRLPGTRLLAIARLVLETETIARVLEPLVADWQREWLAAPRPMGRLMARLRGLSAFAMSATYCLMRDPVPRPLRVSSTVTLLLFAGLGTIVLMLLSPRSVPWLALALLIPANISASLPFAVLPLAMKLGARRWQQAPAAGRLLVRAAATIAMFVFLLHNWGVPPANMAFREALRAPALARLPAEKAARVQPLRPWLREMTLPQLLALDEGTDELTPSHSQIREELATRATMPLVPIVLALFGWSLSRVSDTSRASRIVFWWVFAGLSFVFARALGQTLELRWHLPRELAVWLPLALWMIGTVIAMRARPARVAGREESASA